MQDVEHGRACAWVPAAVVAEVVMLAERGRTTIGLPQLRVLFEAGEHARFLPLDLEQLDEFAALVSIRDPFDRFIVAAARHLRATLVSRDERLGKSGLVEVVWG